MNTCRKKLFFSITYGGFVFLCLIVTQAIFTPKFIYAASLHLTWNPNDEGDLRGYKIYYGTLSANYTAIVDVGNVTEYILEDLGLHQDFIYFIAI